MKVTEIIRAALTRIGVYAVGEEVPADDSLGALEVLNGLLYEYKIQPLIALPDSLFLPLSIHDDLMVIEELTRLMTLSLAIDIAPDYGIEPPPSLLRQQARAMVVVKRANAKPLYTKSEWRHHSCQKSIYQS